MLDEIKLLLAKLFPYLQFLLQFMLNFRDRETELIFSKIFGQFWDLQCSKRLINVSQLALYPLVLNLLWLNVYLRNHKLIQGILLVIIQ